MVVLVLVPAFLLLSRSHRIGDPDTFWHIRAGDHLRATGAFTGPDPWSAFSAHPWVLHEWLPELAFSVADQVAGLGGVAWVWYAGTVLVAAAVYTASRSQGSLAVAAIVTVLGLLGTAASLTPRPQLVSIALSAVVTAAWLSSARDLQARWWLVPLSWAWACSHGLWFVGPIIGFVAVAGMALDPRRRARLRRMALIPVLSILAAALTPVGPSLLLAPLSVSAYTRFVSEWDPPSLTAVPVAVTLLMLLVAATVWLRHRGVKPDLVAVLLWVVAVGWTLAYTRTVAIGAAMAAPLLVSAIETALAHGEPTGPAALTDRPRGVERGILGAAALVCLVIGGLVIPGASQVEDRMPVGLAAALAGLPRGTVVMDEYGVGGWLRYRFPSLKPVIDERTELFTVSHVEGYLAVRGARPGWQERLRSYGATAALLPMESALADALPRELGWRSLGESDGYTLLVARTTGAT